jgi:hypothetical protein
MSVWKSSAKPSQRKKTAMPRRKRIQLGVRKDTVYGKLAREESYNDIVW